MGERAAGTDGGPSLRLGGLRARHGGRLPSSLPIASLPLLHAGKLGHDGGDPGRSGGGRARSERSGRGGPTAVRRSGEERLRLADRGAARRRGAASAGQAR